MMQRLMGPIPTHMAKRAKLGTEAFFGRCAPTPNPLDITHPYKVVSRSLSSVSLYMFIYICIHIYTHQ